MTPKRSPQEQAEHDLAVRRICRARFAIHPEWEAFANPGESRRYALALPDGVLLYPDIIARPRGAGESVCIAEVETTSSLTDEEAGEWEALAGLNKEFLLFVPAGSLLRARELCHQRKIRVHGYATYELTPFWVRIHDFRV